MLINDNGKMSPREKVQQWFDYAGTEGYEVRIFLTCDLYQICIYTRPDRSTRATTPILPNSSISNQ
jgi:hypothetical protein